MSEQEENKAMSFLEHLEAFRWHLVRSLIALVVGACIAFFFKSLIFDVILLAPKSPSFITNRLLCEFGKMIHSSSLCINSKPFEIINLNMAGQFNMHMKISFAAGIILASPYIFYEFWRFISPALYKNERKHVQIAIFYSTILFIIGVLFGYYILTPMTIQFLCGYTISDQIVNTINMESYISTISSLILACGLIFELPVLLFLLTKLKLITPTFLRRYRRHAILINFIIASIIAPPDALSMIIVAVPLLLLYEGSIFISARVVRKSGQENV